MHEFSQGDAAFTAFSPRILDLQVEALNESRQAVRARCPTIGIEADGYGAVIANRVAATAQPGSDFPSIPAMYQEPDAWVLPTQVWNALASYVNAVDAGTCLEATRRACEDAALQAAAAGSPAGGRPPPHAWEKAGIIAGIVASLVGLVALLRR